VPVGGPDGAGGGGGGGDGGNSEKKSKPRLTVKRFQSRHKNGLGSRLRINKLEVHDKGFFTCKATNGIEEIQSTAILIVKVNRFSELICLCLLIYVGTILKGGENLGVGGESKGETSIIAQYTLHRLLNKY